MYLRKNCYARSKIRQPQCRNIDAVYDDTSAGSFKQPEESQSKRRLSRARSSNDTHLRLYLLCNFTLY